jgi:hypothetical protein
VVFRLRNQNDPKMTFSLTKGTWLDILDLAEDHGWNPMGAVLPGQWIEPEDDFFSYGMQRMAYGNGDKEEDRLVVFEDALNLADALEQAFLAYEPVYLPATYFLFEPLDRDNHLPPGIGVILATIDFCRQGAFWIEARQLQGGEHGYNSYEHI